MKSELNTMDNRILNVFMILNNVFQSEQRGSSASHGGSSGGAIGYSSFQGPTTAPRTNFPKYVAGASIAYLSEQGLRPYFFSSSTHKYQKDWLDGICTVTVYTSNLSVALGNETDLYVADIDDNDNTTVIHFECPQDYSCCQTSCCTKVMETIEIVCITIACAGYIAMAIWLTKQFYIHKNEENMHKYTIKENGSNGHISTIIDQNGLEPAETSTNLKTKFRNIQLHNVDDLLTVVKSPILSQRSITV